MAPRAASIRARVRAEMTDEIKASARRQLATGGANLSLRAVSRDLGMVSSAIYRYFASRDDLLTALIIDAYNAIGEAAETADASLTTRSDPVARWLAVAHALRAWALAHAPEYALIYGSPVPGYAAPADTISPASRPILVMGLILADAHAAGLLSDDPAGRPEFSADLRAELRQVADRLAPGVSEAAMARGMIVWTQLFGALSFELFGQLNNVIDAREEWFDHQARMIAGFVGLRSPE
ncbi:MAG TPA: WHG domain-containing protein [Streptosporangiaceae bacterium]|jgi:AcrR family transcriptional regulator